MQEKSKALEDKLAQLTEKYSACWRDWSQEVEVNQRRMAEFASPVSFFAKCSDAVCPLCFCVCEPEGRAFGNHQQSSAGSSSETQWAIPAGPGASSGRITGIKKQEKKME